MPTYLKTSESFNADVNSSTDSLYTNFVSDAAQSAGWYN